MEWRCSKLVACGPFLVNRARAGVARYEFDTSESVKLTSSLYEIVMMD